MWREIRDTHSQPCPVTRFSCTPQHISHPSIVSYLHSFSTPSHHCLVLEYVAGGELFTLVNSDVEYKRVTEPALRRMWGELARAVGWMHGVGLVHRDIKLESMSSLFLAARYDEC